MGNLESKHKCSTPSTLCEPKRQQPSVSLLPVSVKYQRSQSCLVCYGIDDHSEVDLKLDWPGKDVEVIRKVFHDIKLVEHVHTYISSKESDTCTLEGIEKTFKVHAEGVGEDGIFVFYFSGHGCVRDDGSSVLVPYNSQRTGSSFISRDKVTQWINDSEVDFKGKHSIFILDCCHSGGFHHHHTKTRNEDLDVQVGRSYCVISACRANQQAMSVGALESSVFTYFLTHAISELCNPGELLLSQVFTRTFTCTRALTSLAIVPNRDYDVRSLCQEPMYRVVSDGGSEPYFFLAINPNDIRFKHLHRFCNGNISLSQTTKKHVQQWAERELGELHGFQMLTEKVIQAALSCMMMSICTLEVFCQDKEPSVRGAIGAFMHAVAAIDRHVPGFPITMKMFHDSWAHYLKICKMVRSPFEFKGLLEEFSENLCCSTCS